MAREGPRIIIVGAGMAGLSAAAHLVENGLDDITVLEAANRIGGRIQTVSLDDGPFPIELGANWIHGTTAKNSTFVLAESLGVLRPYRLFNRNSCRYIREDGTDIDRDTVKEAVQAFRRVDATLRLTVPRQVREQLVDSEKIPVSVAFVLEQLLKQEMGEFVRRFSHDQNKLADIKRVFNALRIHMAFHEADELHKVCWESVVDDIPGGDVHIPRGYGQMLEYLRNRLPENCVQLQSEAINIAMSDDLQKLQVSVRNGKTLVADHVVVTCSLGYLKEHHATMFKPPLPMKKIRAINTLGFGRVNKIFLDFDRPVTSPTYHSIGFAWDHTDIGPDKREWYRMIFGFDQVFTRDTTLLGWIVGDAAEYMEKLSDEEIGQTCVKLLRKFLHDESIPLPKKVMVSRWCSDEYARGSYSYVTPNLNAGDQKVLAEPVVSSNGQPRILFAGEATLDDFYACTHGARTSGIREAQRLVDLYRKRWLQPRL